MRREHRVDFSVARMQEIIRNNVCFVCGDRNPAGLQLRFLWTGDEAIAECTAAAPYEGYDGILHGGMIATLLDEIMAKALLASQRYAMTAELHVRFRRAIPIGTKLRLSGHVTRDRGRVAETVGQITDLEGQVYATAVGKYLQAPPDMVRRA